MSKRRPARLALHRECDIKLDAGAGRRRSSCPQRAVKPAPVSRSLRRAPATLARPRRGLRARAASVLAWAVVVTALLAAPGAFAQDISTPTANADGSDTLWTSTLTVKRWTDHQDFGYGYQSLASNGSLSTDSFTIDDTSYTVHNLYYHTGVSELYFQTLLGGFPEEQSEWVLYLDGTPFYGSDDEEDTNLFFMEWSNPGLSWSDGGTVAVRLVRLNEPTAPTSLTAVTQSAATIDLEWNLPAKTGGRVTSYKIEVSTDGNTWSDLVADTGSAVRQYSHRRLPSGATRYYRVSAINAAGTGPASSAVSATTTQQISTPTANSDGSETLWTSTLTVEQWDSGNNFQAYGFSDGASRGSLSNSSFTLDGTTYSPDQLHYDTGADELYFRELARFPAEQSEWVLYLDGTAFYGSDDLEDTDLFFMEWSNPGLSWANGQEVAVRLVRLNAPTAPRNLTALGRSSTNITLSWVPPEKTGGRVESYKIEVSTDGGSTWSDLVADTGSAATMYSHTGLTAGDTRHYRVSAINAAGTGPVSGTASATTPYDITTPTANFDGSDTLWTTSLTVEHWTGDNNSQGYGFIAGTYGSLSSSSFTIDSTTYTPAHLYYDLGPAELYFTENSGFPEEQSRWVLYLGNNPFYGTDDQEDTSLTLMEWSNPGLSWSDNDQVAVRLVRLNVPTAPRKLRAEATSATQIELKWILPAKTGGRITGYKIEVSADGGDNWSDLVADTGSAVGSYLHTGLMSGETRHYRVSAINVAGTSPVSDTASATTLGFTRAVVERTNSRVVRIEFDDSIDTTALPDKSAFTVDVRRSGVDLVKVTDFTVIGADDRIGQVHLDSSVRHGEKVKLSYTKPATNPLKTTGGAEIAAFKDYEVENEISTDFPQLSVEDAEVHESGTGTTVSMTFMVSVDTEPEFPVGVHYETEDGTATGGAGCSGSSPPDYVSAQGRLMFGPGHSSRQQVEVTVCDDSVEDSGEKFRLVLRSTQLHEPISALGVIGPEGKGYGEDEETAGGSGTILNTETATEVSIVADAAYAEEGSEAVFTLRRTGDAEEALTVPVTVEESGAMLDADAPTSVTFAAGSQQAALRVATDDDDATEADSAVTATLQAGSAWQVAEGAGSAALTVLDNDAAPVASVSVADVTVWSADMTVVEYGSQAIGAGSADLFSNQTGRDGLRARWLWYNPPARKLSLALDDGLDDAGSLTLHVGGVSLPFPENSGGDSSFDFHDVDLAWSDGETLAARISKPSGSTVSTDATLASLTLAGVELSPAFDSAVLIYRAAVGAGVEAVTVAASANDAGAAVTYEPAADADEELAGHQVAAPAGETLVAVTVTAADGQTQRAYRLVVNRPPTVAVSFGSASYTATEGGDAASVIVELGADPRRDVTIPLTASPAGGAAAEDYTVPGSVTFTSGGALSQSVVVTAVADDTAESGESVVLGFGSLPDGVETGATTSAAVTLADAATEAVNAEPTGLPTISGTPQVGETLTASVTGIKDTDGVENATFAYQWVSNDGTSDSDIEDATKSSYEVLDADEGKTIKVRVTFTDDGGTEETLVSAATAAVLRPLTASFTGVPAEHGGGGKRFTFGLTFSENVKLSYKTLRDTAFIVSGGAVRKAKRKQRGSNVAWEITVSPASADQVRITLPETSDCTASGAICTAAGLGLSHSLSATVAGPVGISVADAEVEEGPGAMLEFTVMLSRVAPGTVTVAYATADGTATAGGAATAGGDYTATSGTLTFAPGETEQTVLVAVLDDEHDEGEETMTLVLSNATGARIRDAEATGTIKNSDPLQQAWLARFGRTVATHVTDAVGERLRGTPGQGSADPGSHLTLGGYRVPVETLFGGGDATAAEDPAGWPESGRFTIRRWLNGQGPGPEQARAPALLQGLAGILGLGPGSGGAETRPGAGLDTGGQWPDASGRDPDPRLGQSRTVNLDLRQLLLGSSFRLTLGADDQAGSTRPRLTAWGRVAATRFDGQDGTLTLDGDVLTGTVGVDGEWDRWLAGVAVAHSQGNGSYAGASRGDLEQTLTSIHPYVRYAVTERLAVWGLVGYGWGELEVAMDTPARETRETATDFMMGAFGSRGVLLAPEETGGFQLATRTDAMLTRTRSDAVQSATGNLAAAAGEAHRLRLVVEGSRGITWAAGRSLMPTVELGLRHDWGDAETGFGVEVGGRVQYADPGLGLTIDGAVRALLAHEDADYEEWGAWGTVRVAPSATGQGLSLTLAPTWGAAQSGVDGLWARQTTAGLAPQGTRQLPRGQLNAEVGYGFAPFDRGVLTPYAGTGLAEGANRTYRLGLRWARITGLQVSLEGTRQEAAGQQPLNQGLRLQADWRF